MMTMEEYQTEKTRLLTLYGSDSRDAGQKRAQEFARLYAESEWKPETLAEVEHMHIRRMYQLLAFGKFLQCTLGTQDIGCTEKDFRKLWHTTDKTSPEKARYAAVAQMLADARNEGIPQLRDARHLGKQLVSQFADGKWRRLSEIAADLEQDAHVVKDVLDRNGL